MSQEKANYSHSAQLEAFFYFLAFCSTLTYHPKGDHTKKIIFPRHMLFENMLDERELCVDIKGIRVVNKYFIYVL